MPAAKKKTTKKTAAPKKTAGKKAVNKKKGKRYTPKEKEKLLAKYNAARAAGKNTQDAAKSVGVPYITLRSWEKKSGKKTTGRAKPAARKTRKKSTKRRALEKAVGRKKKTARKTKAKPKAKGGLVLVTPNGFRIEGISSAELIRVLKALK